LGQVDYWKKRAVQKDAAEAKSKELGAVFNEVSAKNGAFIAEFFKKLSYDL
jgi:hypothetical protein